MLVNSLAIIATHQDSVLFVICLPIPKKHIEILLGILVLNIPMLTLTQSTCFLFGIPIFNLCLLFSQDSVLNRLQKITPQLLCSRGLVTYSAE